MGCGMVRKMDELGRVVVPKEMRRILNIKPGSSIEMFINENNQVVLQKYFEINNVYTSAENLANIIFEELSLPCVVCNDEKVIICKGVNKKEYFNKNILPIVKSSNGSCEELNKTPTISGQTTIYEYTYIFTLISEGFENGFIIVYSENKLEESVKTNISLLTKLLCSFLKF